MTPEAFRRAAYRRLVLSPRRGRLLAAVSYVALADADALWDGYAWPPVPYASLPATVRDERERLIAMSDDMHQQARRLGFRGGMREAGL